MNRGFDSFIDHGLVDPDAERDIDAAPLTSRHLTTPRSAGGRIDREDIHWGDPKLRSPFHPDEDAPEGKSRVTLHECAGQQETALVHDVSEQQQVQLDDQREKDRWANTPLRVVTYDCSGRPIPLSGPGGSYMHSEGGESLDLEYADTGS